MLTAVKSRPFEAVFRRYNEFYLLRRRFRSIGMKGAIDPLQAEGRPLIYIMNHSSWWDGLLAYHVLKKCSNHDHFMMMEERQLLQYPFFRKIGAFSMNAGSAPDIRRSLLYASSLLKQGGRVWIYPQGEIQHLETRPLIFKRGIGFMLGQLPEAAVVPVTLYHGMVQYDRPEATIWFGEPLLPERWKSRDSRVLTQELQQMLEQQLDQHRETVLSAHQGIPEGFTQILRTGRSTSEAFDALRGGSARWR
ncbi:lysophospholipid acyltransferase family protein [Paenibacillus sp. JX-17]|uniref:Lysophospholipid acyltransferase family protein n=1 Tax=Paenibacillus lacisoli TaxID=3064525 RepID=A0ABT9CB61_9BACL|nr:lysophospholipid acyltransferase family protein [Paenibacillus sp. JX-17]MDO7906498.1 lysophospholipid acyltransferase family protein [Paenibacillus sp. JX-17]